MKKLRLLLITLCVTALMGSMAVTAYAGGGEEWDGLAPVEPLPAETVDPGEGFTEDGNLVTRDLLYDKATNKQFITVQTGGGNTFYIVIDYDKPTDEDGEQYQTYFLNMVDEADLLAAMQAAGFKNRASNGMPKKERISRKRLLKKATLPYSPPDSAPIVAPPRLYQPMQLAIAAPSASG